jgi:hypothetical protein
MRERSSEGCNAHFASRRPRERLSSQRDAASASPRNTAASCSARRCHSSRSMDRGPAPTQSSIASTWCELRGRTHATQEAPGRGEGEPPWESEVNASVL